MNKSIVKTWKMSRYVILFEWRKASSPLGRFGGGWDWAVGVQVGKRTVIFNLLVASLKISRFKKI